MTAAENVVKFQALATRLLAKFGTAMDWTVTRGGAYDPGTGEVSGETTTVHSGVLTTPPVPADERYLPRDVVQVADAMVFLAAPGLAFVPEPGDSVSFDSIDWGVLAVQAYFPGDSAAAYGVALRRG